MATTFMFEIDWSNAGSWVDESANVVSARMKIGMGPGGALDEFAARAGTCALTLDNSTQRYSPDYVSGPLYGSLLPHRPVRVRATDGVSTWTLFRGYVERIEPQAGPQSRRQVTITCVDTIALLRNGRVSMTLQRNQRADALVAGLVNLALGAPAASGTVTFTANPPNLSTVTILSKVYRLTSTLQAENDVKLGATKEETADNLRRAINLDGAAGANYHGATQRLTEVVAAIASNVVTVQATLPGAVGNAYALAVSGSGLSASGATLTGGVDYPAGLTNYLTGNEAYDVAADRWVATATSALEAIQEVVKSEQGRFFVQRDGTLTFFDRKWFFKPLSTVLALNADPFALQAGQSIEQVFNVVGVTTHPRATVSTVGVLAQASSVIRIPPVTPNGPGTRTVTLHFRDSAGNLIGGAGIVLPLTATTDYTVNDRSDGTGFDYTTAPAFAIGTLDVRASEIAIPLLNYATGPLYVTKLQVRGQAITVYDPVVQTQEDAASQSVYLRRVHMLDLPLSGDEVFGEALAHYLLDRYKAPFTNVEQVTIQNLPVIGSVNVFSIGLFDVLSVTDSQSGISGLKCYVIGLDLDITADGFTLTFHTTRADDRIYWNLGVTGYGELGTNTRLAV